MVCAGMILAGQQLSPAWLLAGDPNAETLRAAEFEQAALDNSVPGDLRPLLAAPQSELGLVTQRYAADRLTLNGNYDGGRGPGRGGRGGGRGMDLPADGRAGRGADPAPAASVPLSLSLNRIARLKRYDMSWQAALAKLDAGKLSAAGRTELETLKASIQSNLAALETDTAKVAELMPLVPFAPAIIRLNEARIRMEDVNSQQAAGVLTELTKDVARVQARVEAGLNGAGSADALKVSKDLATRGADSVDGLRNSVTTWFNFYNGYDPLFTWWMGMPYKQVDEALQGYAAFLRDKVAPADTIATPTSATPAPIPPAAATKLNEVPDLNELIALPQDEMRGVVVAVYRSEWRARRPRRHQQPWRWTSSRSITSTGWRP